VIAAAVRAHVGQERQNLPGGLGSRFGLGTLPEGMLDRDVRRVQGAVSGERLSVQQNGLFGADGGPFVLAEVGAGQRLQPGQFARHEEAQPCWIGV
jgi:hypothetical protein